MTGKPEQEAYAGASRIGHVGDRRETRPSPGDRKVKMAFGLDLAGYSSGRSVLVHASRGLEGEVETTIYRGHAFSTKPGRGKPLAPIVEKEAELLAACLQCTPLYADVPIDLQGLPHQRRAVYAWQLVKRPADFAFGGLPPLADRIGSVVARFQNVLRYLPQDQPDLLGKGLYETYPAASLRLLGLPHEGYKEEKNRITLEGDLWVGSGPRGEVLALIANGLRMAGKSGEKLNHDELDAVVCALTGVIDRDCLFQGEELQTAISEKIGNDRIDATPPRAYVLMRHLPEELTIVVRIKTVRDHAEMLGEIRGR